MEELAGGLTNRSFKVRTDEAILVVRLSRDDTDLLSIDRVAEHTNSRRAADAGAAPEVVDCLPDEGVMVVAWVEGRTYGPHDLRDGDTLQRVAAACRRLHAGERFANDFDLAAVQRRYLSIVTRHGFRLPDGYLELGLAADRVAAVLTASSEPTVPCNNDLHAANFIDDGERLWIIDYEFSGNNEACFELGNLWSESWLDDDHLVELVDAYYGVHRDDRIARARLWGVLAMYSWTLWASIQDAMSPLDHDYWAWGQENHDRAQRELAARSLDSLLDRCRDPAR